MLAMKKKLLTISILVMFHLAAYAQQTYQLNVNKSKMLWQISTMGNHYGYLLFKSGNLNYSPAGEPAAGTFIMDMTSIRSTDHTAPAANQKVDNEIATPGFFNVPQYPEATMVIKQIIRAGEPDTFNVAGDLTIKGIANAVAFKATIKKQANTINAQAKLKIDRVRWHINFQPKPGDWNVFATLQDKLIADDIMISLNLVFDKTN
jgi:polyisoprenoid-binding protein YceI